MKRVCLALCLLLMLIVSPATAQDLTELSATIVQSSCSIVQRGDICQVYCFAQVHNPTDQVLILDGGMLELENSGEKIAVERISQLWPHFLEPGADGYLFDIVNYEPDEDDPSVPTVTGISYYANYMGDGPQSGAVNLSCQGRIEEDPTTGQMNVICQVDNASGQDVYGPTVTFGLYTEGGAMLYADGMTVSGVGVANGGTMLVKFEVDRMFVEQWRTYGAAPAQVKAIAAYREEMD